MADPGRASGALFAALGLPGPTDDPAAVRAAYVAFSKAHHPDKKGGGDGAAFAAAAAAAAALADPATLARHAAAAAAEAARAAGPAPAVAAGLSECARDEGGASLACRCGGAFLVRAADLAAAGAPGAILAPCDGCSAVARIAVAE